MTRPTRCSRGRSARLTSWADNTHRVAITNARLVDLVDGVVRFRWKDYADRGREKIMALPAQEFLRRFLLQCSRRASCAFGTPASSAITVAMLDSIGAERSSASR